MNHFSNATVEGFITNDPELKITKTGRNVGTTTLAINHYNKSGEPPRVSFLSVEAWEKECDKLMEMKRGMRVMITGCLRQDRWEDEKGKVNSRLKIVANEFIEIKKEGTI